MSPERTEGKDRKEITVSLSVVALVSNFNSKKLLLVQNRETGQWSPPAGGLTWFENENRMETFGEGVVRELAEETGLQVEKLSLEAMVNVPGKTKNHIGAVYTGVYKGDLNNFEPADKHEISQVRFFSENELFALLNNDEAIRRPEFNRGLIAWWLQNEHKYAWDPFRGEDLPPEILDERYLKRWESATALVDSRSVLK